MTFFPSDENEIPPITAEQTLAYQWEDFKGILLTLGDWMAANAPDETDILDELVLLYGFIGGTTEDYLASNERLNELQTEALHIQQTNSASAFRSRLNAQAYGY